MLLYFDVGLFAASLTLLSDYYYILTCPPAPPPPPPPQMIVSTAALLFVRLSVLQSVSTVWPSTRSFCSVWLQVPPPPLPRVHPHLSIMSLQLTVSFTCSLSIPTVQLLPVHLLFPAEVAAAWCIPD